jgi:hypothetical protein
LYASRAHAGVISLFRFGDGGGIGAFFSKKTDRDVLLRLAEPSALSLQEVNQLLVLAHEGSVTEGFYRYYWLEAPSHTYDVTELEGYNSGWFQRSPQTIRSLEHFRWGIYRLYVDGLLYLGNVRSAFRRFRTMDYEELGKFFNDRRNHTEALRKRGPYLTLQQIDAGNRYLVSEIASKAYGAEPEHSSELKKSLLEAYHLHVESGGGPSTLREILNEDKVKLELGDRQMRTKFSANEVLDEPIGSREDIEQKYARLVGLYQCVREAALRNTELHLSMITEMDVYVATSMRSPEDFQEVAAFCDEVFSDPRLTP